MTGPNTHEDPSTEAAIEFCGGPLDGMVCPEGEMADTMRDAGVITIDCDEFNCRATYHITDGRRAEWMAAWNGEPS